MTVERNVDEAVGHRYTGDLRERQESLCCPVSYDPCWKLFHARSSSATTGAATHARSEAGDTILDLGSGRARFAASPRK